MQAPHEITIILADDHKIVMDGCEIALQPFGVKTIAKIVDPNLVLSAFKELRPDVVVLDIRFSGADYTGLQVAAEILAENPQAKIVTLSQYSQVEIIQECFQAGVYAFLTKDCEPEDLNTAIRKAYAGERFCNDRVNQRILAHLQKPVANPKQLLDKTELDVMKLLADGETLEEIGRRYGHSKRWAHDVANRIKTSLGVARNADLTKIAMKFGITDLGSDKF